MGPLPLCLPIWPGHWPLPMSRSKSKHKGKQHAVQLPEPICFTIFSQSGGLPHRMLCVPDETATISQAAICWAVESCSQGTVQVTIDSCSSSHGSRVIPGEKSLPAQEYAPCPPLLVCACTKHFCFVIELFWALPSSLEHFSDITQDILGISGFKITLCSSFRGLFN